MPARAFRREIGLGIFAPFLALAVLAGALFWRENVQLASMAWVKHTHEVAHQARDAKIDVLQMALSIASYSSSGDKRFLTAFYDTERDLDASLTNLATLSGDSPDQNRRVVEVTSLKGKWVGQIQTFILQRDRGQAATIPLAEINGQLDQVQAKFNEILDHEDQLLEKRIADVQGEGRLTVVLFPLLFGIAAVILTYWGWNEINKGTQQFQISLNRAEDANRAKDNFLAAVSHELRNPLNSILLLANILSNEELGASARERVKAIERAARTQAQLIEDLLDISRIESGRLRLDVQATDLSQVVKSAVDSMRLAAEAKSIALSDVIDTSVSLIAGDPKRLEQVVWNLLSNAIKFTPKGGKVQVRLERINSHVEIIVTDNGQGMSPSSVPHVFDRFWQEADASKGMLGVGLGPSIVKELVTLHGGTVMAHSDGIGKGSTFTVRLPLPPASAPLLEPRRHPTVAGAESAAAASRLDGLSLLVVDDDAEAREALTTLLGSLGAMVRAENSAQAALGSFKNARPDVIIADIEMPVQDGFYLARELRKTEQEASLARVPLIALTAYGRVEDKVKILANGFDSHVVKPVDLAELSATIRSLASARAA